MKNIEAKKLRSEYNIIDIRSQNDYNKGHIYNAVNIPKDELLRNYKYYLRKEETYYIYCEFGSRSRSVCEILTMLGYDVINVYGGYSNFK